MKEGFIERLFINDNRNTILLAASSVLFDGQRDKPNKCLFIPLHCCNTTQNNNNSNKTNHYTFCVTLSIDPSIKN